MDLCQIEDVILLNPYISIGSLRAFLGSALHHPVLLSCAVRERRKLVSPLDDIRGHLSYLVEFELTQLFLLQSLHFEYLVLSMAYLERLKPLKRESVVSILL